MTKQVKTIDVFFVADSTPYNMATLHLPEMLWSAWNEYFGLPSRLFSCFHLLCGPVWCLSSEKKALLGMCCQSEVLLYLSHGCLRFPLKNTCRHGPRCVVMQMSTFLVCPKFLRSICSRLFHDLPYSLTVRPWTSKVSWAELRANAAPYDLPAFNVTVLSHSNLVKLTSKGSHCHAVCASFLSSSDVIKWRQPNHTSKSP